MPSIDKEQNGNLGLVVVDYLQLVESTGAENRTARSFRNFTAA